MSYCIQARAYFADLPANQRPIQDTPGNRFWQKQKVRQLPAHDIDILFCNELTDEECKQMELFIKIRREKFLGRGEIFMRTPGDTSRSWVCVLHSVIFNCLIIICHIFILRNVRFAINQFKLMDQP